jgi:hypothetical protein
MSEVQEFLKEFKKNSNGDYSKISNKDLLFFFISKCAEIDKRMDEIEKEQTKTKTSIKNLILFISIIGVTCSILGYIGM